MSLRNVVRTMIFVIFPIFFGFAIYYNVQLMNECKKEYSTFVCASMMQKGAYIIVQAEKDNRENVVTR